MGISLISLKITVHLNVNKEFKSSDSDSYTFFKNIELMQYSKQEQCRVNNPCTICIGDDKNIFSLYNSLYIDETSVTIYIRNVMI